MRLTDNQRQAIKKVVAAVVGEEATITLFGSRVDDGQKGGDVDLLISLNFEVERPALVSAKISARLVRVFQGRKVDVLLSAPNLENLPIHQIAKSKGVAI